MVLFSVVITISFSSVTISVFINLPVLVFSFINFKPLAFLFCNLNSERLTFLPTPFSLMVNKYLSLSIKNGQSNVKSLIHQAAYTGIEDPRPYIKDLIQRELNRLTTDISTMNLDSIDYGFNIKLASQVSYFKKLKTTLAKNYITMMDTEDAVNFYNFKKELVSYEKTRIANNNVCPYLWISTHLKSNVLDKPGVHPLFTSNNIIILAKDGKLLFESTKEGKKYSVNIKLNVAIGLYSI